MTFFVDNNLPPLLAKGMKGFGEDVVHLQDMFPADTLDEVWLPEIGSKGFVLLTRDRNIRKNPAEKIALRTYAVGAFFLGGKALSRWKIVEQVVRNWEQMKKLAQSTRKPFAFHVRPHGKRIDPISM